MKLMSLFRRSPKDEAVEAAHRIYVAGVEQARQPAFYAVLGVPDTLEGRFEVISAHIHLVLRRLGREDEAAQALGQRVFDVMFADMDQSLRELGVGDLSVAKRVKFLAQSFYGRAAAYDEGYAHGDALLRDALARNLYATTEAAPEAVGAIAAYLSEAEERLARQPLDQILAGRLDFPAVPGRL
jgi:cytochrome b pre-mRNA-processing protein 3